MTDPAIGAPRRGRTAAASRAHMLALVIQRNLR
jgi:hypothetical protein